MSYRECDLRDEYAEILKSKGLSVRKEFCGIDILFEVAKESYDVIEVKKSCSYAHLAISQVEYYCLWLEDYLIEHTGRFCYRPVVVAVGELNEKQKVLFNQHNIAYYNLEKILPRFLACERQKEQR